ncbi:asparagine synthase-related protein [Streptomyces sp. ME19-01-6]|uniref:asparagine synthase-related protein n=1 Tax=Streptomyces sp. ME19-01-6 TaxID=3028686 RepID=UPI0029BA36FA|nr:asparagine synthase-related protein [Streptomyces sp. ME19-01-6]MDX3227630.1 asparagine synthase-related protein [Streptomyces sp. ME19-01-6]
MDGWWVVLPDTEAAAALAGRLWHGQPDQGASDCLRHASGRPWLVGRRAAERMLVVEAGDTRLALSGRFTVSPEVLRRKVARVRSAEEVERAVAGLAGSYHVLASVGGSVWARGAASAACRVFTASVDGVPVAASDTDVLAELVGSAPDMEVLAARLLEPGVSWAGLGGRTMWQGVHSVRPDEALMWHRDGSGRTVRWWCPPEPVLPLGEAAQAVRAALVDAVATCTADRGTVSADLSGGLGSTSLCFLAVRGDAELVTARWEGVDARNDEAEWAAQAARALPEATHLVVGQRETPDWFAGIGPLRLAAQEPGSWTRDVAKLGDILRRVQARGSRLHLGGGVGDELFTPSPSHWIDTLTKHPRLVLQRARRQRLDWRVSRWAVLRALTDRRGYRQWLLETADHLTAQHAHEPADQLGWQPVPRMPAWASPQAARSARDVLREAAERCPGPLAPQRSVHAVLHQVREGGNTVRLINKSLPGPDLALPYTDDAVVAAATSARPEEAAAPGRFKPLLTAAMAGIVPEKVLRRTTKGPYYADFYRALHRQRGEMLTLLDGSLLAEAGLIDPDRLRGVAHAHASMADLAPLMSTVGCEIWLRSHERTPHHPTSTLTGDHPGPVTGNEPPMCPTGLAEQEIPT